jgi:hypothetical protein
LKKREIEASIKNAVYEAPAVSFKEIANQPYVRMNEHDAITAQEGRRILPLIGQMAAAAAFCVILLIVFSGWYVQNKIPDSVISLDVNPSIKIVTNNRNRVLSVEALNEDAETILENLDLKDYDLNKAVDAIVAALASNGFLNEDRKTILLSVVNKDEDKANRITASLNDLIQGNLTTLNISPTILTQVLSKENQEELAEQYHISNAKAELIQLIAASDSTLTLDALAAMPMEQLYQLARQNSVDLNSILVFVNKSSDDDNANDGTQQDADAEDADEADTMDSSLSDNENADAESDDNASGKVKLQNKTEDDNEDLEDSKNEDENKDKEIKNNDNYQGEDFDNDSEKDSDDQDEAYKKDEDNKKQHEDADNKLKENNNDQGEDSGFEDNEDGDAQGEDSDYEEGDNEQSKNSNYNSRKDNNEQGDNEDGYDWNQDSNVNYDREDSSQTDNEGYNNNRDNENEDGGED